MNEDVIRNLLLAAEKIRYKCIGSSTTSECLIYIRSDNVIMMLHDNKVIFTTVIPEVFEVHPEIAYYQSNMIYNEDKTLNLDNLDRLFLFDIFTINYARSKYNEYVEACNRCQIVAHQEDLANNESFAEVSAIKSKDGLKFFTVSGNGFSIRIPYFVGLYSIKKADNYGISVYDFDTNHFLVRMIDKKPKMDNIDIIFCILKGV